MEVKTKFEDWKTLSNFLSKDGYLFKFDLKSGYHHLDVFPPHQTYLGFSWIIDGELKYFCFTVLPFGLTSSPYIFIKLLRPLVKFWRFSGLLIVIYIDDGICISVTLQEARKSSKFVWQSLIEAGFAPNPDKCIWEPTVFRVIRIASRYRRRRVENPHKTYRIIFNQY